MILALLSPEYLAVSTPRKDLRKLKQLNPGHDATPEASTDILGPRDNLKKTKKSRKALKVRKKMNSRIITKVKTEERKTIKQS